VRVLTVWEPVLSTDWGSPSSALPAMIADPRVEHFYDRGRRLSTMLGGTESVEKLARESQIDFGMDDVIWDIALVYPPGAAWGSAGALAAAPVVKHGDRLEAALAKIQ
jgi:hypothetical protein